MHQGSREHSPFLPAVYCNVALHKVAGLCYPQFSKEGVVVWPTKVHHYVVNRRVSKSQVLRRRKVTSSIQPPHFARGEAMSQIAERLYQGCSADEGQTWDKKSAQFCIPSLPVATESCLALR